MAQARRLQPSVHAKPVFSQSGNTNTVKDSSSTNQTTAPLAGNIGLRRSSRLFSHTTNSSVKVCVDKYLCNFFNQKPIPYCYYSSCSSCFADALKKSLRLHCFNSDRGEIWQDCSSSKCASNDHVLHHWLIVCASVPDPWYICSCFI